MSLNPSKAAVLIYNMSTMQTIYRGLGVAKMKERHETILEPLQALIQLACLSVCEVGTKVAINGNILQIQHPRWTQGIMRAYNQDNKEDLFFLFNVVNRFINFYRKLETVPPDLGSSMFETVRTMAMDGLDKLMLTYSGAEKHSLLHALNMYKTLLGSTNLKLDDRERGEQSVRSSRSNSISSADLNAEDETVISEGGFGDSATQPELDTIFEKVTSLYSNEEFRIIRDSLILMRTNPQHHETYIAGLDSIMKPTNQNIRKWISENLVL